MHFIVKIALFLLLVVYSSSSKLRKGSGSGDDVVKEFLEYFTDSSSFSTNEVHDVITKFTMKSFKHLTLNFCIFFICKEVKKNDKKCT